MSATTTRTAALLLVLVGCGTADRPEVVVYSSAEAGSVGPVLEDAARAAGVGVRARYDSGIPGVGLARRIGQESPRARCDLFWSGSILDAIRLGRKGMLASWSPPNGADPARSRGRDGTWYGLAPKARVIVVHTGLVAEADRPEGIADLADPRWKGRLAIARPTFGATAAQFTCLFAAWGEEKARRFVAGLKANAPTIFDDDREVALAVGSGRSALGLTGSDDAVAAVDAGRPLAIIYPDRKPGQLGTLFLPEALAIPKGAPDLAGAEALGNALLAPEIAARLARKGAETPRTVRAMDVDLEAAASLWDRVAAHLAAELGEP